MISASTGAQDTEVAGVFADVVLITSIVGLLASVVILKPWGAILSWEIWIVVYIIVLIIMIVLNYTSVFNVTSWAKFFPVGSLQFEATTFGVWNFINLKFITLRTFITAFLTCCLNRGWCSLNNTAMAYRIWAALTIVKTVLQIKMTKSILRWIKPIRRILPYFQILLRIRIMTFAQSM